MEAQAKKCQNCKSDFAIEPDDFGFYEKIKVPPPTFCPDCRFQRRLMFRNERNFYKRKCDLCHKDIISSYTKDAPFPVYCIKCWWSDKWDPKAYGTDYDPSRPFFEQLKELFYRVPVIALMNDDGIGSVNCEYNSDWAFSKNCYLGSCGWHIENGAYMYNANYDKEVVDIWNVSNSELVYEGVNCDHCYNIRNCTLCYDSNNCIFGFDLKGCSNCVMCVGLRSAQYCILNKRYTKEEYEEEIKKMNLGSRQSLETHVKKFNELILQTPRKFAYNIKTLNSTGDSLLEVKLSKDCFYILGPTENSRYIVINDRAKDSYDVNNTGNPELCYDSVTPDNSRGNKFTIFCWKCAEAEYSNNCHSCVNVFGSTGLKHARYAILNKEYSKEEYRVLRERIIKQMKESGEWGEFFPHSMSPFAYNETAALEWFPMTKNDAAARGYRWKENEERNYRPTKTVAEIPDTIAEVEDNIIDEVIECAHQGKCEDRCTEAFRIIPRELSLYRKMNIPLPVLCPNCRHYQRLKKRNPPKLWHRSCTCKQNGHGHKKQCSTEFETSYSPDRKETIYCEACFNKEVY